MKECTFNPSINFNLSTDESFNNSEVQRDKIISRLYPVEIIQNKRLKG